MQYWSITDTGCVRTVNQDAHLIVTLDKNTILSIVCDGMGGAKSGEVASTLAAEVFAREVKRCWSADLNPDATDKILVDAVKLANYIVYEQGMQSEDYFGMGTTLVAVLLQGRSATIVNVGDSRTYSIADGSIFQITTDHSLVQMMIERGELLPEHAKKYPGKNLITRAIGTDSVIECDVFHKTLLDGEYLLLCSDGLTNLVDDQEILFEVVHGAEKEQCCEQLLNIAKNRGAPDNVTCILLQV